MNHSVIQNAVDEVTVILTEHKSGFALAPALIKEINKELGIDDQIQLPDTWRILRNEYAILLLVPFQPEDMIKQKEDILEIFYYILTAFENKKGHLLDGYALLIMDHEPEDKGVLESISEIQINRRVCRMQVLWPVTNTNNPWIERLQYVPVYPLSHVSLVQGTELSSPYGPYALRVRKLLEEDIAVSKVTEIIKEHPYVDQQS